jgi:hypothetical protein
MKASFIDEILADHVGWLPARTGTQTARDAQGTPVGMAGNGEAMGL